jgi:HAD superfamily hydrolase (TIGR01549 family)
MAKYALPQPQAIRTILFDVGFTLLSNHPSIVTIVQAACADRGVTVEGACLERSLPPAELFLRSHTRANPFTWADEEAINATWRGYFAELLRPCLDGDEERLWACVAAAQERFEHVDSYALYPDALPVLQTLSVRGLTLGVVSDWGVGLSLILRHHDLLRYFDFAVISASLRLSKPDPALFETALRRADAIPDYTVHIGDSYILDVLGARAAGITPVLLDRRSVVRPAEVDCLVVRDLYGLLDALGIARPA